MLRYIHISAVTSSASTQVYVIIRMTRHYCSQNDTDGSYNIGWYHRISFSGIYRNRKKSTRSFWRRLGTWFPAPYRFPLRPNTLVQLKDYIPWPGPGVSDDRVQAMQKGWSHDTSAVDQPLVWTPTGDWTLDLQISLLNQTSKSVALPLRYQGDD